MTKQLFRGQIPQNQSDWHTRSYWLNHRPYTPTTPLNTDGRVNVVIVGAGYTGLWTAIMLKEANPNLEIAVLESGVAGYGASGRNGGFAMTMISRNIHDLARKVGDEQARRTHLEMRRTLREMQEFCRQEGIDADITAPGLLTISNGPEQDIRIDQDLIAARRMGLDDFHPVSREECQQMLHSDLIRRGHWEDESLLVDAAALARGLRDAAVKRGIAVYENTPVLDLKYTDTGVEAITPGGTVKAQRALIATNAYANAIPELRKYIFTIYAYIVLTEPLTPEQWKRVGWERRMGVEDKRIMPHFHRPTADGRILWGGRDAPFSPEGPNPVRDRNGYVFERLEETFRETFPQLSDVKIADQWGGPVCGTVNCFATVGALDRDKRIVYALGYAGHGVAPSHLAAEIARDTLLGLDTPLLQLPMVTKRPVALPPGALRRVVLDGAQNMLQRADDRGEEKNPLVRAALHFLQ